ncbi:MAG: SBBP repeat-containing protein, partial [Sphingobacteriaceae bacterium]
KITIRDVYPGIDWVFYNSQKTGMKYDFVVHAGADASKIKLWYEGDKPLKMEEDGSISITTKLGTLTEAKPYTYEENNNNEIESNYKLTAINKNKTLLEFNLANHNTNNTLVIDPQLNWGTFYGGNGSDGTFALCTDAAGNLFATGVTQSTNFPTQNFPTAYFQALIGGGPNGDAFILKFNNMGNLSWATYYGGTQGPFLGEAGISITCNNNGDILVTGVTSSPNFPTFNPGLPAYFQGTLQGPEDAFILKFSNIGLRLWATYYGGSGIEWGRSIDCDNNGNVFITGYTGSTNFPTLNPGLPAYFQGLNAGGTIAFILKFNVANCQRLWATYYGGSGGEIGFSISCDNIGNVFVAGQTWSTNLPILNPAGVAYFQATNGGSSDVFILKFNTTNCQRLWATYYGGLSDDSPVTISCDNTGGLFIVGQTFSANFPTLNPGLPAYFQGTNSGNFDAFILKFNGTNCQRLWATYYGGANNETAFFSTTNIAFDNCDNVYVTFDTESVNIPIQMSQASCGGFNDNSLTGSRDLFLIKFNIAGQRLWASYIGGDGFDYRSPIACDLNNNLFISGSWVNVINNATYPLANPGGGAYYDPTFNGGEDGFIMKFTPIPPTYSQSQTNSSGCSACNG